MLAYWHALMEQSHFQPAGSKCLTWIRILKTCNMHVCKYFPTNVNLLCVDALLHTVTDVSITFSVSPGGVHTRCRLQSIFQLDFAECWQHVLWNWFCSVVLLACVFLSWNVLSSLSRCRNIYYSSCCYCNSILFEYLWILVSLLQAASCNVSEENTVT